MHRLLIIKELAKLGYKKSHLSSLSTEDLNEIFSKE